MSCNMRKSVWKCPTRTNINLIVPLPEWVLRKKGIHTIYEVTFAIKLYVTAQLICTFVFAYMYMQTKAEVLLLFFHFTAKSMYNYGNEG